MKTTSAVSDDSIFAYSRLIHAAKPYFVQMAKKPIGRIEERYPHTVKLLFEVASKYATAYQGNSLSEDFSWASILDLMHHASNNVDQESPEIFDETGSLKSNISEIDQASLQQLFHDYVANLQIPSYSTVELLIEKGKIEKAHETALSLSHAYDKTRSIIKMILYYLNHGQTDKALDLFALLPTTVDRRDVAAKIACNLLHETQIKKALSFTNQLTDNELRDHTLHEMSLWLTKKGQLKKGLDMLKEMSEGTGMKPYTLSLIVSILTGQGNFKEASRLAFSIQNKDYRQDALNDIVKKLVKIRHMQAAEQFVNKLDFIEKKETSRIIESALKAHLQDERIKKIQLF